MSDKPIDRAKRPSELIHLAGQRARRSLRDEVTQEIELTIAAHFREQATLLREINQSLSERVQRLTVGVERLVDEMHGVRTGKKEEAFARVAASDASPDLPTVSAEAALIYTLTSDAIGRELGFHSSQIGLLLSHRGLAWAGNGDYQEIGRNTKRSQTKFWHRDVPKFLRKVLDERSPGELGITDKSVLAIFRKWRELKSENDLLDSLHLSDPPH